MLKRIAVVLIAALVTVGVAAGPSAANSKKVHDGAERSAVDIRRAKFGYAEHTVRTRVFSVLSSDQTICIALRYGKKKARVHYSARSCITISNHRSHRLRKITRHGSKRVKCRGMRVHWRQNTEGMIAKIKVPRRCTNKMGRHASHFRAVSYSGGYQSDHTRRVKVRRG